MLEKANATSRKTREIHNSVDRDLYLMSKDSPLLTGLISRKNLESKN